MRRGFHVGAIQVNLKFCIICSVSEVNMLTFNAYMISPDMPMQTMRPIQQSTPFDNLIPKYRLLRDGSSLCVDFMAMHLMHLMLSCELECLSKWSGDLNGVAAFSLL